MSWSMGYPEEREQDAQARQDARQDACVAEQITSLTEALNARSASTGSLNEATGKVLDSFVKAAAKAPRPDTRTEAERREDSEPIIKALENYALVREKVKADRVAHPFPDFPTGQCEEIEEK